MPSGRCYQFNRPSLLPSFLSAHSKRVCELLMSFVENANIELTRLLLIKDSLLAPGGFVLFELLRSALKGKTQVVLLLAKEPLAHYQYVLRKLGLSLPRLVDEGRVRVISLLEEQQDALGTSGGLKLLGERVLSKVRQAEAHGGGEGVCLITDSLSDVHSLYSSLPTSDWISFLSNLLELGEHVKVPLGTAVLVHKDVAQDEIWQRFIEHNVQDVVEIKALESGGSLEVSGQARLVRGKGPNALTTSLASEAKFPRRKARLVQVHVVHRDFAGLENAGPTLLPRMTYLYKLSETGSRILQHDQQVF